MTRLAVRNPRRCAALLALAFAALTIAASGAAVAANSAQPQSKAQWQQAIAALPESGTGCYQASYPSVQWHPVACRVAPAVPLTPATARSRSATRGGPQVVGDSHDYSAVVSTKILSAIGFFADVSPNITEKGQVDGSGPQVKNAFTLQLNAQFFKTTTCSKSSDPSNCLGWQQFIYDTHGNEIYMQYWLIGYAATCPAGWNTYGDDCYVNSPASTVAGGPVTAAKLASVEFTGKAAVGGNDTVSISVAGGTASLVSHPDSMVHLGSAWNTAEFDVFGDAGGGQANFGAKSTYEVVIAVHTKTSVKPSCVEEGFTGETNNLSLTTTPTFSPDGTPEFVSQQTNGATTTPSCSTIPK